VTSRPSSVSLSRVGTDAPRLLRLRADDRLVELLRAGPGLVDAHLEVPSRESVTSGERVRVEISFGALADEVELGGEVVAVRPAEGGKPSTVVIAIDRDDARRVAYVRQVLGGERNASARAHRRVPVDFVVRWRHGDARYTSRLRDISRGGAFIISRALPDIGSELEIEIRCDARAPTLALDATVTWVRREGEPVGFGVCFHLANREIAAELSRVVREREALAN
jgi:hypothetical protein